MTEASIRIAFFGYKAYERDSLHEVLREHPNKSLVEIDFIQPTLHQETVDLLQGKNYNAVCLFVDGIVNEEVVVKLVKYGIKMVLLRCAGYDHVDIQACKKYGIRVARVAAYSPNAVAEHSVALLMALNRKIHTATTRVRQHDFTLDGLVGNVLNGKTVGVLGTGRIGKCFINIMLGFGCKVIGYDVYQDPELLKSDKFTYVQKEELFSSSDIISLHMLLTKDTEYMINKETISMMKPGVIILNVSRGKLIETKALLDSLENGKVAGAGLDVYENEGPYFFEDHSNAELTDGTLLKLIHSPRVILTSHQAFLTHESLQAIGSTVIANALEFFVQKRAKLTNEVL